ncbi:serine/threonine-protein kinase [Nocardioides marmotae]|uniref:serine/threonine-protein kinase n=1 Tax=Nocardioides marmotae TaxID=2663857 RepID=UPI0012B5B03E|nr:serine/threonine-protein kinase [Nocardioides marmotae]MBC9732308.1 protein kinase [Nocardioides marmotae]MTB83429.1 protein kinase [Nocardioides marmotae]
MQPAPTTVFAGRYRLLDHLGEGGMGTVWRVLDEREQRVVAAKVLGRTDAVSLLRFLREQATRVVHPHVLTPIGWAGEDDLVLFTMPVVEGGSLEDLVRRHGGPPPVSAPVSAPALPPVRPPLLAAELLRQLLAGLAAIHAAGVVHRDVKPANLLLHPTGSGRPHLVVSDFGVAVDLAGPRLTETGAVVGTPGYLAPEVAGGAAAAPAADLYAAGQVALFLLLGAPASVPGALPARPDRVPDALWDLLADLVAADPAARPSAEEALDRLGHPSLAWHPDAVGHVRVDAVTAPLPGAAGVAGRRTLPEPTRVRAPREPRRPSALRAGLATVLLAGAAVALVLALWRPWAGPAAEPDPAPAPSPSAPVNPSPTPSSTGPSGGATPSGPAASAPGSVEVGRVVTRVGQPCEAAELGLRETTLGGVDVVCRAAGAGGPAWRRAG